MRQKLIYLIAMCMSGIFAMPALAQNDLPFPKLGKIKTLKSNEIRTSRWSIGGETLDRDYADYHSYKPWLGLSGAKRIRLQAGWAKCEKVKGVYDFKWLDEIVDDAISQGVSPWLQPSYGNPIYEGGGQPYLAGGIPTSKEALEAWDNWVRALVTRYSDRVKEWEVWNEPDISKQMTAQEFAVFHVRTCDIIRQVQPGSFIIALGLAGVTRTEYVTSIMDILKKQNKLDYMNALSYHGYASRPENSYPAVMKLRETVDSYGAGIELWQGENGAPSTPKGQSVGALTREDWSETTQAKWILRRMMGDIGHDVDVVNVFTISDIRYLAGDHMVGYNSKGLLKSRPDNTIMGPKPSYYAYQHTVSLLSEKLTRIKSAHVEKQDHDLMVFSYNKEKKRGSAIICWFGEAKPADSYTSKPVSFIVKSTPMKKPVVVDLFTGLVYQMPTQNYRIIENKVEIIDLPVADYPMAIVDKSWLKIVR